MGNCCSKSDEESVSNGANKTLAGRTADPSGIDLVDVLSSSTDQQVGSQPKPGPAAGPVGPDIINAKERPKEHKQTAKKSRSWTSSTAVTAKGVASVFAKIGLKLAGTALDNAMENVPVVGAFWGLAKDIAEEVSNAAQAVDDEKTQMTKADKMVSFLSFVGQALAVCEKEVAREEPTQRESLQMLVTEELEAMNEVMKDIIKLMDARRSAGKLAALLYAKDTGDKLDSLLTDLDHCLVRFTSALSLKHQIHINELDALLREIRDGLDPVFYLRSLMLAHSEDNEQLLNFYLDQYGVADVPADVDVFLDQLEELVKEKQQKVPVKDEPSLEDDDQEEQKSEHRKEQQYQGTWEPTSLKEEPLMASVDKFLESTHKIMVLLGDAGTGKSLATLKILKSALPHVDSSWLPIRLDLKTLEYEHLKAGMEDVLRSQFNLKDGQLQTLRERQVFFILDGYDELRGSQDNIARLYDILKLSSWLKSKVLVSCRTRHLKAQQIQKVFSRLDPSGKECPPVQRFVLPFVRQQVDEYIQKQVETGQHTADQRGQFDAALQQNAVLKQLVRVPFVLRLFVEALPRLRDLPHAITRFTVYQAFVEEWFVREVNKLPADVQKQLGDNPAGTFERFAELLAWEMFKLNKLECAFDETQTHTGQDKEALQAWRAFEKASLQQNSAAARPHQRPSVLLSTPPLQRLATMRSQSLMEFAQRAVPRLPAQKAEQWVTYLRQDMMINSVDNLSDVALDDTSWKDVTPATLLPPGVKADMRRALTDHHDARTKAQEEQQRRAEETKRQLKQFKRTSPLRKAGNRYSFIHKSFFEFFVARYLLRTLDGPLEDRVQAWGARPRFFKDEIEIARFVADGARLIPPPKKEAQDQIDTAQLELKKLVEQLQHASSQPEEPEEHDDKKQEDEPLNKQAPKKPPKEVVQLRRGIQEKQEALQKLQDPWRQKQNQKVQQREKALHEVILASRISEEEESKIRDGVKALELGDATQRFLLQDLLVELQKTTKAQVVEEQKDIITNQRQQSPMVDPILAAAAQELRELRGLENRETKHQMVHIQQELENLQEQLQAVVAKKVQEDFKEQSDEDEPEVPGQVVKRVVELRSKIQAKQVALMNLQKSVPQIQYLDVRQEVLKVVEEQRENHPKAATTVLHAQTRADAAANALTVLVAVNRVGLATSGAPDDDKSQPSDVRDFTGIRVPGASLMYGDLSGARLNHCNLAAVELVGSNLTRAHLNQALLHDLQLGVQPTLQGQTLGVFAVAVDPSTGTVVSGSGIAIKTEYMLEQRDGPTVKLWDRATGQCTATLRGHTHRVFAVAVDPRTGTVVSGSADKTVKLWDRATGQCTATLQGHTDEVRAVAVDPTSGTVVSGSRDTSVFMRHGTVKLWDRATGQCTATLQGHTSGVLAVAVDPRTGTVVSGSDDGTVKLWDRATGQCTATLRGHASPVSAVAVDPTSGTVVSGSRDKTVKLWDRATGQCTATLQGHTDAVLAVAVDPRTGTVVSGSFQTVKLWDRATGQCTATLRGVNVLAVAVDPRTGTVVSGSGCWVKIWDRATGQCTATLRGHTGGWVCAVAVDPRTGTVVSGSVDKTVKLWDRATGQCTATLQGHTDAVRAVAVDPTTGTVVSGSGDGTVKLWDRATGQCTATLQGHTSAVSAVAVDPTSGTVVSGSTDGTVKLWDRATGQCVAHWALSGTLLLGGASARGAKGMSQVAMGVFREHNVAM